MKFEHLIQINDITNPTLPVLTRQQLWNGLVLRAEMPKIFVSYLDESQITERFEGGIKRALRYGELIIQDEVNYDFLNAVHYQVPQQGDIPKSSMYMTIQEPEPDALFVRFSYDSGHTDAEDIENETYNDYRRSAYVEGDIDTIKVLRELWGQGRLDNLMA